MYRRTLIRKFNSNEHKKYLTIPLNKFKLNTPLCHLMVNHSIEWQDLHLSQIKNSYKNAMYYDNYINALEVVLLETKSIEDLSSLNIHLILWVLNLLGIETKTVLQSFLHVEGKKTDKIVNNVIYFNGKTYLSGSGAKVYQDESLFERKGIGLFYQDIYSYISTHPYHQNASPFVNGLSILDSIFNIGAHGIIQLFNSYDTQKIHDITK